MSALHSLLQSHSGLFERTEELTAYSDEPQVITQIIKPDPLKDDSHADQKAILLSGAGTALHAEDALIPALGEALERYCATVFSEDQVIWASANELGSRAIDLNTFPLCSEGELQNPACPLQRPTKTDKIRWVQGLSLSDGNLVYLPLLSVYITPPASKNERFLHPISTGCAAHTSYEAALLSAILEVIERDALSIAWLQQLELPKIDIEDPFAAFGELWDRYQQSSQSLQVTFFDATTDIGVPTIYGVRVSLLDQILHTVVACSSSLDPAKGCRKVMLELASCVAWLRRVGRPIPDDVSNFNQLHHGASYMARRQHAKAFGFLLNSHNRIPLADVADCSPSFTTDNERTALLKVLTRLKTLGFAVYAADLSSDEALRADMRVVRVVIPGLMPFSWVQRARFLGHARLYKAPRSMGYSVRGEHDINPWPQPFG